MHNVISVPHTSPQGINPSIVPDLAIVIDRAMAKAPDDRYQSVAELSSDLQAIQARFSRVRQPVKARHWSLVAVAAIVPLAIMASWIAMKTVNERWARRQVPTITRLAEAGRTFEAYDLARRAREYLPGDPRLVSLMPAISTTLSVTSDPAGANVFLRRYDRGTADAAPSAPTFVGTTPLSSLEVACVS
jgi:hypothetical protein